MYRHCHSSLESARPLRACVPTCVHARACVCACVACVRGLACDAMRGVVWHGMVSRGVARRGMAWHGVACDVYVRVRAMHACVRCVRCVRCKRARMRPSVRPSVQCVRCERARMRKCVRARARTNIIRSVGRGCQLIAQHIPVNPSSVRHAWLVPVLITL